MRLLQRCYDYLACRRWLAVLLLVVLVGCCAGVLTRLSVNNDIRTLLPDGDSQVAREFELLGQAPMSRKLVIQLHADEQISKAKLIEATAALGRRLDESGQIKIDQFKQQQLMGLLGQLTDNLPLYLDERDWQQIEAQLNAEAIDRALAEDRLLLMQPQGMMAKQRIRQDPLDFQRLVLAKLSALNPVPVAKIEQGQFVSSDGRNSLLLGETAIPITDVDGARQIAELFRAARAGLPPGVSAELLSGHLYTLENATTIQRDMRLVVSVSAVGMLLIFAIFLRSISAIAVYLLPLLALLVATAATQLVYGSISGITFGFGAVLLGITIDYGLHVYFPLLRLKYYRGERLAKLARPMLTGGVTTLAAFGVLLGSVLPGQRQLAFFSIVGIVTALLLALCLLPQFIRHKPATAGRRLIEEQDPLKRRRRNRLILFCWLLVMVLAASQIGKLRISGELRQLSYVPQALQSAEQHLRDNWGDLRSSALIFASGASWDEAFSRNQLVWQQLQAQGVADQAVSMAPLLISQQLQQQRAARWAGFWAEHGEVTRTLLAEGAQKYGFSATAFSPFEDLLLSPPQSFDWQQLQEAGLSDLMVNFAFTDGQRYQVLSLVPDKAELVAALGERLKQIDGVELVSQSRFGDQLATEIFHDFKRFIGLSSLLVVLVLILVLRSPVRLLLCLLPVISGILFMLGGMAWLGLPINIFNVIAAILVIGLGVDYGVFIVGKADAEEDRARRAAILVSGLTTIAGFGALALARHPAMNSIGVTVMLGIVAAVPTAVLVVPLFTGRRSR